MTRLRTSPVRALRRHLGISQAALARYLGVSRELVALVEATKRELPGAADRKFTDLLTLLPIPLGLAPPLPPPLAPTETAPDALIAPLRIRLRQCRHEAARLRYRLEDMQRRAAAARRCLQLAPALLAALPAPPAAPHDRLWLELLAADATADLTRYGAPAQTMLTLRLTALADEIAGLEQALAAQAGQPPELLASV